MANLDEIEATLDEEPADIEVFKEGAIELTRTQSWDDLEAYYIRQLRRIDGLGEDEIKFHLWYQLGQIYELRLKQYAKAEQAYQVALSLEPDNGEVEQRLGYVQAKLED